jgi:hypothetical protein
MQIRAVRVGDKLEIATGKVVLSDTTFAHVGYDMPGPQQRFASQRTQHVLLTGRGGALRSNRVIQ